MNPDNYQLANEIISNVMVIWASQIVSVPFHNYNDNPTFSEEARRQPKVWNILRKWSNWYWAYFEQVKQEKVEKFGKPIFNFKNPYPQSRTELIRNEFLSKLATQDNETAIELMAILIVECARRLNAVSNETQEMKDDVQSILYFTDIQFQLA